MLITTLSLKFPTLTLMVTLSFLNSWQTLINTDLQPFCKVLSIYWDSTKYPIETLYTLVARSKCFFYFYNCFGKPYDCQRQHTHGQFGFIPASKKKSAKYINGCNVYSGGFFFFNMPPSCTFVMFNLGENSMKDLIDMVQKFVNDFNWPLILPVSFCARTWSHWVALVAIKVPL